MKRPRAHQIGDLAENFIERKFLSEGWIVHKCLPDYGFDFLVEPSYGEANYSNLAFLQVKGTESNLNSKIDGTFPFAVSSKHLELWFHADVPSYLCVVELELKRAFLGNTGYFLYILKSEFENQSSQGELFFEWLTKHQTRTILLEPEMLIEGDRLSRMAIALHKVWEKLRATKLSNRTPDMAWSPVIGVKVAIEEAFPKGIAEELFEKTGTEIYGDF